MAGMAGAAIDINVLAVKCMMELHEVRDQAECMDKVQLIARTYLSEKAKRRKQDEDSGSPS
jgi:hypothetical protein